MKELDKSNPVEQIQRENHESLTRQMEALATNPALRELVRDIGMMRFNYDNSLPYELGDFEGLHAAMDVFDSRTKKDGTYGERNDAEELIFDDETDDRIYSLAQEFGLTGDTVPSTKDVDAALVLGGAGKSPLTRALYTQELMDTDRLNTNTIIFLASDRPVDEDEQKRGGEYAEGATTEFELNIKAAEKVFGVEFQDSDIISFTDPSVTREIPFHARIAHTQDASGRDIFVISAPITTDPFEIRNGKEIIRRRANTRDTYAMLKAVDALRPGAHVVGITNAHFVPFQGADAKGQLGALGIAAEIVGFDPSHYGDPQKPSQQLLQEMLTVADSLARATK
jgi:hypothetical protein